MLIFRFIGGAEEDRTPDPLLAKQVLSQLSYSPLSQNPSGTRNPNSAMRKYGGPKWTRTTDPSLIRAVL